MTTTETPDPTTHARAMTQLFALAVEHELPEYLVAHLEQVAERACLREGVEAMRGPHTARTWRDLAWFRKVARSLAGPVYAGDSVSDVALHWETTEETVRRAVDIIPPPRTCPGCGESWLPYIGDDPNEMRCLECVDGEDAVDDDRFSAEPGNPPVSVNCWRFIHSADNFLALEADLDTKRAELCGGGVNDGFAEVHLQPPGNDAADLTTIRIRHHFGSDAGVRVVAEVGRYTLYVCAYIDRRHPVLVAARESEQKTERLNELDREHDALCAERGVLLKAKHSGVSFDAVRFEEIDTRLDDIEVEMDQVMNPAAANIVDVLQELQKELAEAGIEIDPNLLDTDDPNPAPPPGAVTWTVRRDGDVVGEVVAQLWHEARGLAVVEYGEGVEVTV